jgi:hypothetical protein
MKTPMPSGWSQVIIMGIQLLSRQHLADSGQHCFRSISFPDKGISSCIQGDRSPVGPTAIHDHIRWGCKHAEGADRVDLYTQPGPGNKTLPQAGPLEFGAQSTNASVSLLGVLIVRPWPAAGGGVLLAIIASADPLCVHLLSGDLQHRSALRWSS